jgi:hypothetical protein
VTALDVPRADADDDLPAPLTWHGDTVLVAPGMLLVGGEDGWRQRTGPPGTPLAAVVVQETVYVLTTQGDTVTLWASL